jgi:2'-5' RNA ligase
MPRLFTGLEIPHAIGQHVALLRGGLPGARWIEPSDYHVTLRFVGDVDARLADELAELLGRVRRRAFTLSLAGLGHFGKDRPHSVHALVAPSPDLIDLQAEHERLVRRLGLAPETRRFTPHVTLARFGEVKPRALADWLAARGAFASAAFAVGRFVLFSSRASVGGGPYVVEEAYPLVAA